MVHSSPSGATSTSQVRSLAARQPLHHARQPRQYRRDGGARNATGCLGPTARAAASVRMTWVFMAPISRSMLSAAPVSPRSRKARASVDSTASGVFRPCASLAELARVRSMVCDWDSKKPVEIAGEPFQLDRKAAGQLVALPCPQRLKLTPQYAERRQPHSHLRPGRQHQEAAQNGQREGHGLGELPPGIVDHALLARHGDAEGAPAIRPRHRHRAFDHDQPLVLRPAQLAHLPGVSRRVSPLASGIDSSHSERDRATTFPFSDTCQ